MNKVIMFLALGIFFSACEKKTVSVQPEDLNSYSLDATFDDGRTVHFKQFNPETTNEGLLAVGCFFDGDHLSIGFGATNFKDATKSNGFDCSFNVSAVTSARAYQFAKENASATNTTSYIKRIKAGSMTVSPSPLLFYSNQKNYRRFRKADGGCDEEEIAVDFQTIDITTYSSKNGGTIEGSFDMRVYNKPDDNCVSYKKERITGSFKLKRVNF